MDSDLQLHIVRSLLAISHSALRLYAAFVLTLREVIRTKTVKLQQSYSVTKNCFYSLWLKRKYELIYDNMNSEFKELRM